METQTNIGKSIKTVSIVTLTLLLIPFVAMQISDEVNWSFMDFVIMGILIFSTGLAYTLLTKYANNLISKIAFIIAIGTTFLMIWSNLAVGLIGSGAHAGNLMYIAIYGLVIFGSLKFYSNLNKMSNLMFATVGGIAIITLIAFVLGAQNYPGSSTKEILMVNGFFAVLYSFAGILFRDASKK